MTVGITGHQSRQGIDWLGVTRSIEGELKSLGSIDLAVSSLAIGTDQIFAEAALALGIPVLAILPFDSYEECFRGEGLQRYKTLLQRCTVLNLHHTGLREDGFLKAGEEVVRRSDVMIAVWDGRPAEGKGGTADIVSFAKCLNKKLIHINPILFTIERS